MVNVETLVELAEKGHNQEIIEYNRIHVRPHEAKTCDKCLTIAGARMKVDQAAEYGEYVVLYIP